MAGLGHRVELIYEETSYTWFLQRTLRRQARDDRIEPLYYRLIQDEGATSASTVTYLLPIIAVALGAAVLGETITWNLLVGTIIVLAGVALSERRRRPTLSRPEPAATSSASTVHTSAGPGTTRPP
jgi:hypothetical protein